MSRTDRKQIVYLGLGGSFLLIMGIIAIVNISPYKDCGWLNFMCTPEKKTPSELLIDYVGPVFVIILGSLALLVLILMQIGNLKHWQRKQSQKPLSEEEKEKVQERIKKLTSENANSDRN
ncbi:MAG: hypothetical protein R3255_02615 [Candidatus Lokiarchaeia archaeon]|nr:hypothetical protein [Candidatus Lokiarchaeia archaeon]